MKFTSGKFVTKTMFDDISELEDEVTKEALAGASLAIADADTRADLSARMLDMSEGKNDVKFDANNRPSIMVHFHADQKARIDFLSNSGALFNTASSGLLHPAFYPAVSPSKVRGFWLGKYTGVRVETTNFPNSLKGLDPANSLSFDWATQACADMGTDYHLMTNAEWAYVGLLAMRMGFQCRGNDYYGKSYQAEEYGTASLKDSATTGRTLTGSGPLAWRHDGSPFGVSDMRGPVRMWVGGYRTNEGEIQVIPNNAAADTAIDQGASSTAWKAIMPDGSLVAPGTEGTLKWDYLTTPPSSGTASFELATSLLYQQTVEDPYGVLGFSALAARAGVTVPDLLKHLMIMPCTTAPGGTNYMRNNGERLSSVGGFWGYTSSAGFGFRYGGNFRSNTNYSIGLRSGFLD